MLRFIIGLNSLALSVGPAGHPPKEESVPEVDATEIRR